MENITGYSASMMISDVYQSREIPEEYERPLESYSVEILDSQLVPFAISSLFAHFYQVTLPFGLRFFLRIQDDFLL